MRCFSHVLALGLGGACAGCPTTPPSLPGPGLGSGDDASAATLGTTSTGDSASSSTGGDIDAEASGAVDASGGAIDDTTAGGTDDGDPMPSCGSSPQMCTMASPYDGRGLCDPYVQDCAAGEKCMPVANDGGNTWNATACRALAADPGQIGDVCTLQGAATDGLDDCDVGLICWGVVRDQGTCIPLCGCGPVAPTCPGVGLTCRISNGGSLPVCLPSCDPLAQDCPPGQACYPRPQADGFACAADASGTGTNAGDPCEFINACSPGQVCIGPRAVPGCEGATGCCASVCDLDDPAACGMGEVECISWWMGMPPPGCPANVGVCAAPG